MPLAIICNLFLARERITLVKHVILTLIQKVNRRYTEHIRPVNLTPVVCKLVESSIAARSDRFPRKTQLIKLLTARVSKRTTVLNNVYGNHRIEVGRL